MCASGSVIQCFGLAPSSAVRLAEFGSWLCHFAQINLMSQYHSFHIDKMGMLKELHCRVVMSKDVALSYTRCCGKGGVLESQQHGFASQLHMSRFNTMPMFLSFSVPQFPYM